MTPAESGWAETRGKVDALRGLSRGSAMHRYLVGRGIDEAALDEYLGGPRGRKHPDALAGDPRPVVAQLLRAGGAVAGGAAVRFRLQTGIPRDYDVFFSDYSDWVRGFLAAYREPAVDVCIVSGEPWAAFDLAACCCSYDLRGVRASAECDEAFATGVSSILLGNVFHPVATLRRVAKYGTEHGFGFRRSEVEEIVRRWGVRNDRIVQAALSACGPVQQSLT